MNERISNRNLRANAEILKRNLEKKLREFVDENFEEILEYRANENKKNRIADPDFGNLLQEIADTSNETPVVVNFFLREDLMRKIYRDG